MHLPDYLRVTGGALIAGLAMACDQADRISAPSAGLSNGTTSGQFQFTPLPTSTACTNGAEP